MSLALVRLCGWRLEGQAPALDHYVVIAAPHTSNWDFIWMILMATALGMKISWFGKHTLFAWPFGPIMRALGGVAVKRDSGGGYVDRVSKLFAEHEQLALAVPVEGTRQHQDNWRSGFYRIAELAGIPIVFAYLDYGRRRGGIGPTLMPTGRLADDMAAVRQFYEPMRGKYPQLSGPVRLREE